MLFSVPADPLGGSFDTVVLGIIKEIYFASQTKTIKMIIGVRCEKSSKYNNDNGVNLIFLISNKMYKHLQKHEINTHYIDK